MSSPCVSSAMRRHVGRDLHKPQKNTLKDLMKYLRLIKQCNVLDSSAWAEVLHVFIQGPAIAETTFISKITLLISFISSIPCNWCSTHNSHLILCVHWYREIMLHCGYTLPGLRKQEATYKSKCSAAEISREGMLSKLESKEEFCLKYKVPLCQEVPFFSIWIILVTIDNTVLKNDQMKAGS